MISKENERRQGREHPEKVQRIPLPHTLEPLDPNVAEILKKDLNGHMVLSKISVILNRSGIVRIPNLPSWSRKEIGFSKGMLYDFEVELDTNNEGELISAVLSFVSKDKQVDGSLYLFDPPRLEEKSKIEADKEYGSSRKLEVFEEKYHSKLSRGELALLIEDFILSDSDKQSAIEYLQYFKDNRLSMMVEFYREI